MIYRYAWKVDPEPHKIKNSDQLKDSYLKGQLLAIGKLGQICHQMRTEALEEYFHHAQAYLRWDIYYSGSQSAYNSSYKELILSSPLLMAHLRHVTLYWADPEHHKKKEATPVEAMLWLHCLKQLRTIEVVIRNAYAFDMHRRNRAWVSTVSASFANLRGLEKAAIKVDIPKKAPRAPRYDWAGRLVEEPTLETRELFQRFKGVIESLATLPKVIGILT